MVAMQERNLRQHDVSPAAFLFGLALFSSPGKRLKNCWLSRHGLHMRMPASSRGIIVPHRPWTHGAAVRARGLIDEPKRAPASSNPTLQRRLR